MANNIDQHSSIPVIDLAQARSGSDEDVQIVAKKLYEAFKNVGFAYVKNHGVPEDVVNEAFNWVCRISLSILMINCAYLICLYTSQRLLRIFLNPTNVHHQESQILQSPAKR